MVKKAAKTSGLFEEIAGDAKKWADTSKAPPTKVLSKIGKLAADCRALEDAMAARSAANEEDAVKLRRLYEETIPLAMNEAQTKGFTMLDGTAVEVEPFYYGEIKAGTKDQAFAWLRKEKHGDLIKEELKIPAGRGKGAAVKQLAALAKKLGLTPEQTEGVHASTWKAFVKEQYSKGKTLPEKLFSVYTGQRAKFTAPKAPSQTAAKQEKK